MTTLTLEELLESLTTQKDKHDSSWELTLHYSKHANQTLPSDDYSLGHQLLEVEYKDQVIATTNDIFDSWTGRRWINGTEFHGPVYNVGSGSTYTGNRSCKCSTCQTDVLPHFKAN